MKAVKQPLKSNDAYLKDPLTKTLAQNKMSIFRVLYDGLFQVKSDRKAQFITISFLGDAFLLNLCFFVFYYLRKSEIVLSTSYVNLFLCINVVWLLVSLITRKFSIEKHHDFKSSAFTTIKTTLYLTYLLSFSIIVFELFTFSRAHVFGTCAIYAGLELTIISLYFITSGKKISLNQLKASYDTEQLRTFSLRKFMADLIVITGAFYFLNYWKRETFLLTPDYEKALLIIYGVWFLTSAYTGKFSKKQHSNFVYAISPHIKSMILSIATLSVIVFLFRLSFYSRLQIFGTLFLAGIGEILLYLLYSDLPLTEAKSEDIESVEERNQIFKQEALFSDQNKPTIKKEKFLSADHKLEHQTLKEYPKLLKFLKQKIDFSNIAGAESVVLDSDKVIDVELSHLNLNLNGIAVSDTLYKIQALKDKSLSLFINLRRVNDIRRINRFFLEIHKKLHNKTYFVGRVETISTHRKKIYSKYPKPIAGIIYYSNFIFFRLLPKIPFLNKLYFLLSGGKNRILSRAEILGRLYFCGFKIIATQEIGDHFCFIAQKIKTPSIDQNPSFGPFIKLRRIGYGGKVFFVNKFRTMHPYSEYLQEYIYEHHKIQDTGKFNNDIRVTTWGKIFRQLWIDELPQIANYFRGDLTLVGVRALSQQYFDLYPKDLQALRIKFYPGLIPPYYADLPKSFDEIIQSERNYLSQKQRHPYLTDLKYFFKALFNILFRRARSS